LPACERLDSCHRKAIMSDFHWAVLRTLRIFGPTTVYDVAARLNYACSITKAMLDDLARSGLAIHTATKTWDISWRGRVVFSDNVKIKRKRVRR